MKGFLLGIEALEPANSSTRRLDLLCRAIAICYREIGVDATHTRARESRMHVNDPSPVVAVSRCGRGTLDDQLDECVG